MKKKEQDGNNSSMTNHYSAPGYDPYHFNKLIDDALGNNKRGEEEDNEELSKLDKKIKKATEIELLKLMNEGKWDLISEFKYRIPHLKKWVDELEYQYWDDHDQRMSQWK
jgi:hypothetical protein